MRIRTFFLRPSRPATVLLLGATSVLGAACSAPEASPWGLQAPAGETSSAAFGRDAGPGDAGPAYCGGFAAFPCPGDLLCLDDPSDDCDPEGAGRDCIGICRPAR